jgi:hypothetical protein
MSNSSNLIFEVIQLRAEVKLLRAEVRDVRNSLIEESNGTTKYIKDIYGCLTKIEHRVDPLWRRIFPESETDDAGDADGRLQPPN